MAGASANDSSTPPRLEIVARAAGQELTSERLAGMLGTGRLVVQRDVAGVIAEVWVNYQLLGRAAVNADSLSDTTLVDRAMWATIAQTKINKFYAVARRSFPMPDTTNLEQQYVQSPALAAQHILVLMPQSGAGMSDAKKAGLRLKADSILKRATSENFADLVAQYSEDQGSKDSRGTYAMFPPGQMLAEFESAVRSVKPGEIVPRVVATTYGFHIIRRHTLNEVRLQFIDYLIGNVESGGRVQFLEKIYSDGRIVVRPGIVAKIKDLAKYPLRGESDRTVLATSRLGNFTGASFVRWMYAHPQGAQFRGAVVNRMADSTIVTWVREFIRNELLLAEADRQNVTLDEEELARARSSFSVMLTQSWIGLRMDTRRLADIAVPRAQREREAATRADEAVELVVQSGAEEIVEVPQQLGWALRTKYAAQINQAGLDRTVTRALSVRAALDSTRAKPPSAAGAEGKKGS
ncbi:MAG TPA: peptidylprolyl isomerase [Gemmatimonadaceae bacterium]|nr:peptidylprolyl isomerase [Gemmatimonadaceae bacterium]